MREKFPIHGILNLLEKEKDCVFLETARCDEQNYLSYIFLRPKKVISTCKIGQIKDCLRQLDQALEAGYYTAGFLSYEAGEAFEQRLRHREEYEFPLLWFGVYKEPLVYNHRQAAFDEPSAQARAFINKIFAFNSHQQRNYSLKNIRPNISQGSYTRAIAKIKDLIARGLTYQVNYTFKLKFAFSGSSSGLYLNLRNNQSVSYSALIKAGCFSILSFSPELFFRKKGAKICVRPMKGTAKRGKDLKEDSQIAQQLANCPKNRSENLMIVDLLRNDLGRISDTGSIKVPRLFNIERYQTLFQMWCDIEGRLKRAISVCDIFSHIFPSGSVTGAPKIKTMQIIRKLEKEPRRVYTGSIGFFSPEKSGSFNVAIRTLLIDSKNSSAEMGVGSGIVYDSNSQNEYAECRLKANFLVKKHPRDFQLIETMRWQPKQGYFLLKPHLKRLKKSAEYFDFCYNQQKILAALAKLNRRFKQNAYKVRLLLDKDGNIKLESSLIEPATTKAPKVYLSPNRTDSQDSFLYHKTTNRKLYSQEYNRCRRLGFYDAIFSNEKSEITEGAISNVFVRKNGRFYTPPLSCGVLDGVYRKYLFSSSTHPVKEKVISKKDLFTADEIFLSNALRGLVKVRLERKNY